ncbi:OmpH family outer membrane protein [bacterium]|nr:OmpH family outer membrane protein [bacterium]
MKKNFLICAVFGFALLISGSSFAGNLGVIDMTKISEKAKVMKSLNGQKDKLLKNIQTTVDSKRKDFEKREAELKAKSSMLSEDAKKDFMNEVANFQRDVMEYDKTTATKVNDIEKAYMEALAKIQKDYLDVVVKKIGKEKGLDLVFNSQTTIIINKDLDITDTVISELDKQVSEIELKVK